MNTTFIRRHSGIIILMACFILLKIFMVHTLVYASTKSDNLKKVQRILPGQMGVISEEEFIDVAKTDYLKLLEYMAINYDSSVVDYTGTFVKQERIRGKLGKPQTIKFKFRNEPFSIFMEWTKNPGKADRLLFVKGQNNNKMILHPAGLLSLIKSIERDPRSKEVFKHSLSSCDQFGIRNMISRVTRACEKSIKNNNFKAVFAGEKVINKRPCIVIETDIGKIEVLNYEGKTEISEVEKIVLTVDLGLRLPVSAESFDAKGKLVSKYTYSDLIFNTNLTDENFKRKANKL